MPIKGRSDKTQFDARKMTAKSDFSRGAVRSVNTVVDIILAVPCPKL